jgi:thioesterase domain-containing protein/aryl carrier-like protein
MLAEIWAELLGMERVGRHDNFFELGGHSLLALQLLSKLKCRDMGISLAKLFTHPTIEALAYEGAVPNGDALLQRGAIPLRRAGYQLPLFLLPDLFGEVLYGPGLTRHLAPDFPVYGLSLYRAGEAPLRTIDAMAARLRQVIRAIQPVGPYRLAGWSFGGKLAYGIAAQLIGEDEDVQFVGLIDSYYARPEPQSDEVMLQIDFATRHVLSHLSKNLTASEIDQYLSRARMHLQANSEYQGQPIPAYIHLFAAQDNAPDDIQRGWGQIMPQEKIRVIAVPGDHYSMVGQHVASLGAALSRAMSELEPPQPKNGDYFPLVTIQGAPRGAPALFCIPGAGANVASFSDLAGALGQNWSVHGLQPRGLDGLNVPHSTVQAAARAYLDALKQSYPEGPVHLLGHSFGGWVAFEMALQLKAAGRAVTSLTLVDSEVPDEVGAQPRGYNRTEALMELVRLFEHAAECSLEIACGHLEALDVHAQLELLHARLVKVGLMPARSRADVLLGPVRTFETARRTCYHPQEVYPGPVRLVLVSDTALDGAVNDQKFLESFNGWRCFAPNLVPYQGPGNHMTVLKPPHVNVLAGRLLEG